MVTRSEVIRAAIKDSHRPPKAVPFYLQKGFWDIVLQTLGFTADVLGSYNKPVAVKAIATVLRAANREILNKDTLHKKLTSEIQSLTHRLNCIDKEKDPLNRAKIDGQLEMVMELLEFLRTENGQTTNH